MENNNSTFLFTCVMMENSTLKEKTSSPPTLKVKEKSDGWPCLLTSMTSMKDKPTKTSPNTLLTLENLFGMPIKLNKFKSRMIFMSLSSEIQKQEFQLIKKLKELFSIAQELKPNL